MGRVFGERRVFLDDRFRAQRRLANVGQARGCAGTADEKDRRDQDERDEAGGSH